MQEQINQLLQNDPLRSLVQDENFVGWIYSIDYDAALVITNDLWKANALGVPHNCFLVATSFNPETFAQTQAIDREVILLRVVGSARLPEDDDVVRTKIDHFQRQTGIYPEGGAGEFDDLTLHRLQFGGLNCRVLGTFYSEGDSLKLGSDLESFATASRLNVFRPRGAALERIVNYIDPLRREAARLEAIQLGLPAAIPPFRIGTVRYTSTDRLHRRDDAERVPVEIQPSDFLARRTAVLGMTRTGKSNMVKQAVSVVKRVADAGGVQIGQIIYDINGEYANANQQDQGSIADLYPGDTVRYRMLRTAGFEELQNNFYLQIDEGFRLTRELVQAANRGGATDVATFLAASFDEPDAQEVGEHTRWEVKIAAFQALLFRAGFEPPENLVVRFRAAQAIRDAVDAQNGSPFPAANSQGRLDLTPQQAVDWFLAVRAANQQASLMGSNNRPWLDDETKAMLNMMANRNEGNTFIAGHRVLEVARPYHSARRAAEVGREIYDHLRAGRIVIMDLSVGDAQLRERISEQVAREIFQRSMLAFTAGQVPPNILVYIEEAHNLLGKELDLTDTWPRLAKEGAKYRIGLVYATQEVSSVHPNILSNTENWFISHLNNAREIRELAQFYDFDDFSRSLMRAQDVGFTRVKTLSSPFVVPVQIDRFDPQGPAVAGN